MHLKTILIFSSVCFFTGTISQGLNAKQIHYFQKLVWNHFDIKSIKHGFSCIGIAENYNDCTLDENINNAVPPSVTAQGLFKILNCMVKVDKWGDNKDVAKMDINNVEDISNKFKDFDIDTDGFLNKKEISEFIKHFELSSLTRNLFYLTMNLWMYDGNLYKCHCGLNVNIRDKPSSYLESSNTRFVVCRKDYTDPTRCLYFKYMAEDYHNCNCHTQASLCITSSGTNKDRPYYYCAKPCTNPQRCNYFKRYQVKYCNFNI